jgi:hypothetical protein
MRLKSAAAVLLLLASPLAAAEGRYIVCDNGLRCFKAPCPSSTVRDLATGQGVKGIYPDISRLPDADQQRIRETDALYFGRLVLTGRVERVNRGRVPQAERTIDRAGPHPRRGQRTVAPAGVCDRRGRA